MASFLIFFSLTEISKLPVIKKHDDGVVLRLIFSTYLTLTGKMYQTKARSFLDADDMTMVSFFFNGADTNVSEIKYRQQCAQNLSLASNVYNSTMLTSVGSIDMFLAF